LISWSAKKQVVVSRSSTKAEYRSLAIATTELYWLCMLFKDIHVSLPLAPVLWCDNVSALALASNPMYHAHTKHIEVDYHLFEKKSLFVTFLFNLFLHMTKYLISSPRD
jgi:hypothetical protein